MWLLITTTDNKEFSVEAYRCMIMLIWEKNGLGRISHCKQICFDTRFQGKDRVNAKCVFLEGVPELRSSTAEFFTPLDRTKLWEGWRQNSFVHMELGSFTNVFHMQMQLLATANNKPLSAVLPCEQGAIHFWLRAPIYHGFKSKYPPFSSLLKL